MISKLRFTVTVLIPMLRFTPPFTLDLEARFTVTALGLIFFSLMLRFIVAATLETKALSI